MKEASRLHFVANCAAGLEKLVAEEVVESGGALLETDAGVVRWSGSLESAYRVCLWSRFASRVLLAIQTFSLKNNDDIYNTALNIDWSEHLRIDNTFSVSATLAKGSAVTHNHYAALRVKDGIADFFSKTGGPRPDVKKERADFRIHLHISGNRGTIYVDLSGDSLHRRGYRESTGIAPLKETLAAAVVALSGWRSDVSPDNIFVDPMCGSGTLLIEAALIWGDSAPGLSRKYYGFSGWLKHDEDLWTSLVNEAIEREEHGYERQWPAFIGYDCDPEMVAAARKNIKRAGLEEKIVVKRKEIAHLKPAGKKGFVVSNLPYGERLSSKGEVGYVYSGVGNTLKNNFGGWRAALLITETDLADRLGIDFGESYRLYNGPLICRLFTGIVGGFRKNILHWGSGDISKLDDGVDFYNRLLKNCKKLSKWAEKNSVSCFRIYDRDLPEHNLAIDLYERYILVQEYAPSSSVDENIAKKRLSVALHVVRSFFATKREQVFIKQRKRQKGKNQYQKKMAKPKFYQVSEGGCTFLVNFTNYLDSGLFLDHRPIRMKIAGEASGKKFLNLFGYTGTASVHAAKGGAALTTTVDLSANYLEWAKNNFLVNGLSLDTHRFIQQDCLSWLREAEDYYDIIFIDPPTFSNTKKKNLVFDIQKNHPELIVEAAKILDDMGVIYFSTNFKGFRLDNTIEDNFSVRNISRETIPLDFQRSSSIHKCWEIRKATK